MEIISPDNSCYIKVQVSRREVAEFNASWPCSKLRDRSYWFEFDHHGDLIDTDLPDQDDGPEATALAEMAQSYAEACG